MLRHAPLLEEFATRFDDLNNIDDLVLLLNKIQSELFKKKKNIKSIKKSSVNYYAFHAKDRYVTFEIPKKNGKARIINAPKSSLKIIQKCINIMLEAKFQPHKSSHGFLRKRNIVTNARGHISKNYVFNIDLKDFFNSISFRRIKAVLELKPFSLSANREPLAFIITNLCCHNGVLPQGAPSSPLLTNIICQRLDRKLSNFSRQNKIKYTRYADDLTFSSNIDLFNDEFIKQIESIVLGEGFELNKEKTRLQNWKQRQEVTGIVVNEKINITRKYVRDIRSILHNYQNHGTEFTQKTFANHWRDTSRAVPNFDSSVKGRIEYLGMIKGKENPIYQRLKKKYLLLFSDDYIDYSFIKDKATREQLEKDLTKLTKIKQDSTISLEDKFIESCVLSFVQIELLLNYYLSKKMTFENLKLELVRYTLADAKSLNRTANIFEVNSSYKIFLFEKYFFYKEGQFYDSVITKMRIIRNFETHRQNMQNEENRIVREYEILKEKVKAEEKRTNEFYKMGYKERHLENEYKALVFLKEQNFPIVMKTIKSVVEKIKSNMI